MLGGMFWILGVYRGRSCSCVLDRSRNGGYGIRSVSSDGNDLAAVRKGHLGHRRSQGRGWYADKL